MIETPLSAASATMDLLLKSWTGNILVFPVVPSTWQEATFRDLRAKDGFLVSAVREAGSTSWIARRNEAGEPCLLKTPDWRGPLTAIASRQPAIEEIAPGEYRIDLHKGESAILFPRDQPTTPSIHPLPMAESKQNPFGVKRGGELKKAEF